MKQDIRNNFRTGVFNRDKYTCKVCGFHGDVHTLDAHHIYNRELMPGGGYVLSNGITLCKDSCHLFAEEMWNSRNDMIIRPAYYEAYRYDVLYNLIGSSYISAFKDCTAILPKLESYYPDALTLNTYLSELQHCDQDAEHHLEGNVYFHTQLIIEELKKVHKTGIEFDLQKLILVALLHDIAKPKTTKIELGKITSPGHSKLGEKISREILNSDFNMPFSEREDICSLVRYHGLPFLFIDKHDGIETMIKASLRCNLFELSLFSQCDFKGRLYSNKSALDDILFNIAVFDETAEKYGCWDKPYQFYNDQSKLHYFKFGGEPTKMLYDDPNLNQVQFIMLVGLPGSGKNTILNSYVGYEVIELDLIRKELNISPTNSNAQGTVIQEAKKRLKTYLANGHSVVWNSTNVTEQIRSSIIDIALNYNSIISITYIDCKLKDLKIRNNTRIDIESMPFSVIEKLSSKLEIPQLWECHKLNIIQY